jgi:hypothetical protein
MTDDLKRGEFNNNPGNINFISDHKAAFKGQVGIELVMPGHSYTPRFGRYDTAHNGMRALAYELCAYRRRYGVSSIGGIIAHWAPSADHNNTLAYIDAVERRTLIDKSQQLDVYDPHISFLLTGAIIHQEQGRCIYSDDEIMLACTDAIASQPSGALS